MSFLSSSFDSMIDQRTSVIASHVVGATVYGLGVAVVAGFALLVVGLLGA